MNERIFHTMQKMTAILSIHKKIVVGISGGSDSDIILDLIERVRTDENDINYVFVNTGVEFRATHKHIEYLQNRYNVEIKKLRGVPIPTVIKKYGIPLLSKEFSHDVESYCRDVPYAIEKINKIGRFADGKKQTYNDKQNSLAQYCKDNNIKVHNKCCDISKKKPLKQFIKDNKCDLTISGERKAEGGIRVSAHKSCYEENNKTFHIDKYMPLWYWSNEDKAEYEKEYNIIHSDCYMVYGMKRTGCVGCPFSSNVADELEILKRYEPNLYTACINIFGESYKLHDMFNIRKKKVNL